MVGIWHEHDLTDPAPAGKEAGGGDDDDGEARPLTQAEAILLLTAPE